METPREDKPLYPVTHQDCGEPAFFFNRVIFNGEMVHAEDIVNTDGSRPEKHSTMMCGNCGGNIYHIWESGGAIYKAK